MKILCFTAGLLMAHQVMGKAARDTLFVFYFGAGALPLMKVSAAAFAVLIGLAVPRAFQRYGTTRAVPTAFGISGLLHILEYALRTASPRLASILVYLHIVAFSAILLSSFWLLLSERFDPAEARRWFGRLAGYGTLGGIAGGLIASAWSAANFSGLSLFLVMGVFHIVCGLCLFGHSRESAGEPGANSIPPPFVSPRAAFSSAPYLRTLALIVFLGTTAAAMLDILFVATASANLHSEAALFRFFAAFQTVTQIASFLLQSFVVRQSLDRFSIGKNLGALPAAVVISSLGAVINPGFAALTLARGLEYLVRGSFFRSAYEVFYSPIPPQEKRAAKNLVDVVFDRAGDAAGSFIVQFLLRAGVTELGPFILPVAVGIGIVNLYLSLRLGRRYPEVVHRGLTDRVEQIHEHLSRYGDWSVDKLLLDSRPSRPPTPPPKVPRPAGLTAPVPPMDETTRRVAWLRSGDPVRVRQALDSSETVDSVLVPLVIELLGWGEVWKEARAALVRSGQRHMGQFLDRLTDPDTDFSIRRRLPSVIAAIGGPRAAETLTAGLADSRFEVRLQCARALDILARDDENPILPQDDVLAYVDRELSLPREIWRNRPFIDDQIPSPGVPSGYLEGSADHPADYRLELIFSLLALIYPRDLLKAAFRALRTKDKVTYALGLEYVESLLPADLRAKFHALIAEVLPPPDSSPPLGLSDGG